MNLTRLQSQTLCLAAGILAATLANCALLVDDLPQAEGRQVASHDWPQFGGTPSRNNAPAGRDIPTEWDVASGRNIKWSADLGSVTYSTPVVSAGKVFIGTNNSRAYLRRYPNSVDLGVLLCFRESDGAFLWQHSSEKLPTGRTHDWPSQGVCSTAVVEGDRLWFVTNRGEVVCLDTEGFYDKDDDGPESGVWVRLFTGDLYLGAFVDDTLKAIARHEIPQVLREEFATNGVVLPEQARLTTVENGQKWVISPQDGAPAEFRLCVENRRIACFRRLPYRTAEPETHGVVWKNEADVVWSFDMMQELRVSQHNKAPCSPTILGDVLFVCTGNGVDESHIQIPSPDAPSFIALDKRTGKVLWTDNSPGRNILHGQWSSPAAGVFDGVPQVLFPGGDGWLYSFRADRWNNGKPELLWKFDCNPKDSKWALGGRGTRNELVAVPVISDGLVYVATGQDPEHGEGSSILWCIDPKKRGDVSAELVLDEDGKPVPHQRFHAANPWLPLMELDPRDWAQVQRGNVSEKVQTDLRKVGVDLPEAIQVQISLTTPPFYTLNFIQRGRIRQLGFFDRWGRQYQNPFHGELTSVCIKYQPRIVANPNSAAVWKYDGLGADGDGKRSFAETMHRTLSCPVIKNGILFAVDFGGLTHCLDAKTGKLFWTCELDCAVWGSPLAVEGKIYIADEDGDVAMLNLSSNQSKSVKKKQSADGLRNVPLHEVNAGNTVYATPIVANNVLYIARRDKLLAIAPKAIAEMCCVPPSHQQ